MKITISKSPKDYTANYVQYKPPVEVKKNEVESTKAEGTQKTTKIDLTEETLAEKKRDEVTEKQDLVDAIEKTNRKIKYYDKKLEISIHEETKHIMVKVIDTEDNSVIREIPSEKILDMAAKMWELAGIIVDEKR